MLWAFGGGLLIGASASLAWAGARQITGISGIVGRFIRQPFANHFSTWFLLGLLGTSVLLGRIEGPWQGSGPDARPLGWLAIAGLLVGFGTRLGSGCTSGHGVCGLSRLSLRSLAATVTFMLVAAVVVFITRHAFAGELP